MLIWSQSDIGNVREINQDSIAYKKINEQEAFAILCDGMGGHRAGEVASKMACQYILEHFETHDTFYESNDVKKHMHTLINDANHYVNEKAKTSDEYEGMGTTIVMCYVLNNHVYISHVGDSRAYVEKDGHLMQVTIDDTLVNALLESGYITKSQAETHPQKNVLVQAIGVTEPLNISFYEFEKELNILLCSDGLYNSLSLEKMEEIFFSNQDYKEKCNTFINEAKKQGGLDNISVLLMERGEF